MKITDTQWQLIEPILTDSTGSARGGRPRVDNRQVVNGILWVLLNGAQWADLPSSMGAYATCWRRYREWQAKGIWTDLWITLVKNMDQKQLLECSLALWQGNFVPMKKGK